MENIKKAISCIDDVLNSDYHYDETIGYELTSDDFEWLEEAKKALEKRIPVKPIGRHTSYKCPVCDRRVRSGKGSSSRGVDHFCQRCGQALDWSDTE